MIYEELLEKIKTDLLNKDKIKIRELDKIIYDHIINLNDDELSKVVIHILSEDTYNVKEFVIPLVLSNLKFDLSAQINLIIYFTEN